MLFKKFNKNNKKIQAVGSTSRPDKKASRLVLFADKAAGRIIVSGGILVIIAVLGILVFLVAETLPLFKKGGLTAKHKYSLNESTDQILSMGMDEYNTVAYILQKDGSILLFHAKSGVMLNSETINLQGKTISAAAVSSGGRRLAFGFSDGSVQFARINFIINIITAQDLPKNLHQINNKDSTDKRFVYSLIPGGQYRKMAFEIKLDDSFMALTSGTPVKAIDYHVSGEAERLLRTFVIMDSEGEGILCKESSKINLLTGERRTIVKKAVLPPLPEKIEVSLVLLTEKGETVLILSKKGRAYRYDTYDFKAPLLAEISPLFPGGGILSCAGFLAGGQSVLIGGGDGSCDIYFILNRPARGTIDKKALVKARSFDNGKASPVFFCPSSVDKSFAVALDTGEIKIFHATSQKTLVKFINKSGSPLAAISLSPRMNGIMTADSTGSVVFREFSVPHPETTFSVFFKKVWYEGYDEPSYTWQSSAGTDDYESKFSLIPLIFGSLKAAFYSMIFAVPIAILGAVYTSEFIHSKTRNFVKPTMEMLASVPSVVLGFMAALVIAPVVEEFISSVLLALLLIPSGLITGSLIWQMLPGYLAIRWGGMPKLCMIFIVVIGAALLSVKLGFRMEDILFHGDLKGWLNGDIKDAGPFIFLLILPVSFFLTGLFISGYLGKRIARMQSEADILYAAGIDICKWLLTSVMAIFAALIITKLLLFFGSDARNGIVGAYTQRNTLIIAFAMGFAVIPIIYTIAEDALNAVPDHLRAASLGCGASTWQTAIYVVLPASISGVFSAIMIGMGRAVGETMIVVMAAGNTPLMDVNIFNGLRALSATIAVELPEAVKDGTLYRILFLCALVLFAMTFVVNTIAEVVRIRFRKRTMQL